MERPSDIYDPVFLKYGQKVYSREYIDTLRERNLQADQIYNIIPQAGFQEKVCENDADILIIGGKRGGGKTAGMEIACMRNINNPLFTIYGFRREEKDIEKGLWNTSQKLYTGLAEKKESSFTWVFPSGAKSIYEHLQDEKKVDQRFRGVEMPCIIIDELPQISLKTFFFLIGSNRNTIGVKNQFIASCNPVGPKHWVHQLLSWYIDPVTKQIIPERNGKTRYFFKFGETISDIAWGNSKEEVYQKVKDKIDALFDEALISDGLDVYNMISSLCFIEGNYSENKIFIKQDASYLAKLAQQGDNQSFKDIKGIWDDYGDSESIIPNEDWEAMFSNTHQRNGIITAVADVALSRDAFVIGAFDGNHLFDIEYFKNVGSITAFELVSKFLNKHKIPLKRFAFDTDGVGNYLKEPCKVDKGGAYAFHNNSASTNSAVWYNQKAECAEHFVMMLKERAFSIEPSLLDKIIDGKPLLDHLNEQRKAIRRKDTSNGKYQLINKPEMKKYMGGKRSPDIMEMIIMHEHFNINKPKGEFKGLGLFKIF